MTTTTLIRGPGEAWAGAGRAIAGGLGALLQGEAVRQRAQQEQEQSLADIYYRNMMGNQAGANAVKIGEEATGLRLTNEARQAPVDVSMPAYMQLAQRLFQMTGDTNMERFANAGTAIQTQGIRDQAVANVDNLDMMNRLNTLASPGETYMPFSAVGNTGGALNQATGQGTVFDEALRSLFADESGAKVARDRGAANASNAAAARSNAQRDMTLAELEFLNTRGSRPGTGAEGSEGALSSTILNTLRIPALDDRGRPVRNPLTGQLETQIDQAALSQFYAWATENNRRPTATAFAQWEAQGRPSGNKNPAPAQPAGTMSTEARAAALARAREAIARGAPRDKVIERLRQNGIDPTGL
ncbi:hypothetical protein GCM10027292_17510 [Hydrogenophaga aquatica]